MRELSRKRLTRLSPIVAARLVGAPGTDAGVAELLVPDDELVPTAFVRRDREGVSRAVGQAGDLMGEEAPVTTKPPTFEVTV